MTHNQELEIIRLASLLATARCRQLAVTLGHRGLNESPETVAQRVNKARDTFTSYVHTVGDESRAETL